MWIIEAVPSDAYGKRRIAGGQVEAFREALRMLEMRPRGAIEHFNMWPDGIEGEPMKFFEQDLVERIAYREAR